MQSLADSFGLLWPVSEEVTFCSHADALPSQIVPEVLIDIFNFSLIMPIEVKVVELFCYCGYLFIY